MPILTLLKINIVLSAGYLLYQLLLRRLTFYSLNRFFLLGVILAAATSPWLTFPQEQPVLASGGPAYTLTSFNHAQPAMHHSGIADYLQPAYWAGVAYMSALMLIRGISLIRLYRKSRKATCQGFDIRIAAGGPGPFSFFRSIFIDPGQHAAATLDMALKHERVHVQQLHSLDTVLAGLMRIFCWFNPFSWLLASAIQKNLEFIADNGVLKQEGIARKLYQYSLLQVGLQQAVPRLAHSFSFSHLKSRIHMMNRTPSSRLRLGQFAAATGLFAGLLVLVGIANGQQPRKAASRMQQSGKTQAAETQPTVIIDGRKATAADLKVVDPNTVKSVSVLKGAHAEARYGSEGKNGVIEIQSKPGQVQAVTPAGPAEGASVAEASPQPLFIIDGKKAPGKDLESIKPEAIESVSVFKGDNALALYGEEGRNGVIEIKTRN